MACGVGKDELYDVEFAEFEVDISEKRAERDARRIEKSVPDADLIPIASMYNGYDRYKIYVSSCKQVAELLAAFAKNKVTAESDSKYSRVLLKCNKLVRGKLLMRLFQDYCRQHEIEMDFYKQALKQVPRGIPFELGDYGKIGLVIKFLEEYELIDSALMYGTNCKREEPEESYVDFLTMPLN